MNASIAINLSLKWYYVCRQKFFNMLKFQPMVQGYAYFFAQFLVSLSYHLVVSETELSLSRIASSQSSDDVAVSLRHTLFSPAYWL